MLSASGGSLSKALYGDRLFSIPGTRWGKSFAKRRVEGAAMRIAFGALRRRAKPRAEKTRHEALERLGPACDGEQGSDRARVGEQT